MDKLFISNLLCNVVFYFARFLEYAVLANVLLSWIPAISRENPIRKIVDAVTEPILSPIRKLIYKSVIGGSGMMIDFSPVVAGVFIEVAKYVIICVINFIFLGTGLTL